MDLHLQEIQIAEVPICCSHHAQMVLDLQNPQEVKEDPFYLWLMALGCLVLVLICCGGR